MASNSPIRRLALVVGGGPAPGINGVISAVSIEALNRNIEVFGIERWELWGIGLRCRIKVLPHERDNVRREFTRRLVAEFDRRQIKSP